MKKQTLFLLLVLISTTVFFACKKNTYPDNTPITQTPDSNIMKYVVNGITGVNMKWSDSVLMPLAIVRNAGKQESVKLSVTGLPANVTASFSSSIGTPDFTTLLTLRSYNAAGGTYTLKLVSTTASDSVITYDIPLTLTSEPPLGCAPQLAGNYGNSYLLDNVSGTADVYVDSTSVKNKIRIVNVFGPTAKFHDDVYGNIDCEKRTIDIYDQTVDKTRVWGTGSFSSNGISLTLYVGDYPFTALAYCTLVRK